MSNWISVNDKLPENQKEVLAYYKNGFGKKRIVKAMFVEKFKINADDFFEDYEPEWGDYSDEDDIYYVKSGWYECADNFEYGAVLIDEEVLMWTELPELPKENK